MSIIYALPHFLNDCFLIFSFFRKGSVLANFTVSYQQVSYTEALILQDSIEIAGYIGEMPVELKNMTTRDGKLIISLYQPQNDSKRSLLLRICN